MPPGNPVIRVMRQGDTSKPDPFTIVIVSNPALEKPSGNGQFVVDPITLDQPAFDASAQYIDDVLFGNLPNQKEKLLSDRTIQHKIRVVSLFVSTLQANTDTQLVEYYNDLLSPRRSVFIPFLSQYGLKADIAFAVSESATHTRASALSTTDDDNRPGISFTFDGQTLCHRYYCLIPGTIALHLTSRLITPLHEFSHALSSYTNGLVVDLYNDGPPMGANFPINIKAGRPIPQSFAEYNGTHMASDLNRDGLGYDPGWTSYHCALIDPTVPAVMDDYTAPGIAEHCQHDKITRAFLLDRLRAKISR